MIAYPSEALQRAVLTCEAPNGKALQLHRLAGIEDYLFIHGDYMSAAAAARRLGVTPRTICRYRAVLRAIDGGPG